jgi:predicted transcriptional regulator
MKEKKIANAQIETLFLHAKPVRMLTVLKGDGVRYATQVSKSVDCTYSHTVKVLDMFKTLGLVNFEKKGRVKIIRLTNEGIEIAHDFEGLRRKFKRISSVFKEPTFKVDESVRPPKASK